MPAGHMTRARKKEIRKERRRMRKELWQKGIKRRSEYEECMVMLDLVIRDEPFWLLLWRRLRNYFVNMGLRRALFGLVAALLALFFYAFLANMMGFFRVTLSSELITRGFLLSYDESFSDPEPLLDTGRMQEVNAINIQDIQEQIAGVDGPLALDNLTACSFYVKNGSSQTQSFKWSLNRNRSTRGVDKACWLLFFEDGQAGIYSMPNTADPAEPERQEGLLLTPFRHSLATEQYTQQENGAWALEALPFEDERIIHRGSEMSFAPGEVKRFTVIIWVEGNDPDAVESMLGGHAGFGVTFKALDEADERPLL